MKAVQENTQNILHNKRTIDDNKRAIDELKNYTFNAFESAITRYEKIIHRLIVVVVLSLIMLFVSNAVWIYAWKQLDFADNTVINNTEGTTSFVGGDTSD